MPVISQIRKTILYVIFSNSKIISIILALTIIIIGAFIFLIPKYQGIRNQGLLDFGNKQENLTNRQLYFERLQKMVDEFNGISETEVNNLRKLLPDSQEVPELFVMLDQLGKDMGMDVVRIAVTTGSVITDDQSETDASTSTEEKKTSILDNLTGNTATANESYAQASRIGTINIVVGIEASDFSYAKFKNMLNTIEENMRILDLNTISYSSDSSSFVLNMTTYYLVS